MKQRKRLVDSSAVNRRQFLKAGIVAAGAISIPRGAAWQTGTRSKPTQPGPTLVMRQPQRPQGFKTPIPWSSIDTDRDAQDFNKGHQSWGAQDFVRFQNWLFDEGKNPHDMVRAANPRARVLFYRAVDISWNWQENWNVINGHKEWFAYDLLGKRIKNRDDSYLMDISNPTFRAYQIDYCMANYIRKYSLDGLTWDGPTHSKHDPNVLAFARELKQALGSKLLIPNSTSLNPGDEHDDALLAIVDGTIFEIAVPGVLQFGDWMRRMIQRNLGAGKSILISQAWTKDHKQQVYWYAIMLLFTDGARVWYERQGWFEFSELHIDLGTATGPARQEGSVWIREFSKTTVRADLGNGTASVTAK